MDGGEGWSVMDDMEIELPSQLICYNFRQSERLDFSGKKQYYQYMNMCSIYIMVMEWNI